MNYERAALVLSICFVTSCQAWSAEKAQKMKPEALLAWAHSEEDLRATNTPPLLMRADLQVSGSNGGPAKGGYVFAWASPSRWREEIKFKGYDRVRVGTKNGYWQASNLDYRPEFVNHLEEMLYVGRVTHLTADETLSKIAVHKRGAITEDCTKARTPDSEEQTLCFNAANGTLLSVENPILGISRIEYSGFNSVDGKLVPYEVRAWRLSRVVAEVKITSIGALSQNIRGAFSAPAHAEFWETCDDMRPAKVLDQPKARYPQAASGAGVAIFYAVIEADGDLSHATPVEISGPLFVQPALQAFKGWRFRPAVCGGKPIRVPTTVVVTYVR